MATLLPSDVKDIFLMAGTPRKKGGKKYSASTIITKKQKLYPHWIKKYKINTKYFVPIGMKFSSLPEYEPYWGTLKILNKKTKSIFL